ncbi:MAG: hypothetical protein HC822_20305 [Oscillochloris sp.]|nr:hypothetical protein [Oscillochloris sp.]
MKATYPRFLALPALLIAVAIICTGLGQPVAQAQPQPVYFVPDQVIVSGAATDVNRVVRAVSGSTSRLSQLTRLDLSYTAGFPVGRTPFPFTAFQRQTLVSDLYRINPGGGTIAVVLRELNAAANNAGVNVRVDPNYATGKPPALQASNPWSIGGSPVPGGGATPAPNLFHAQWALGPRGIELYPAGQAQLRSIPQTGKRCADRRVRHHAVQHRQAAAGTGCVL